MIKRSALLAVISLGFAVNLCHAGPVQSLADSVKSCAAEGDDVRRLQCYDAIATRMRQTGAAATAPASEAATSDRASPANVDGAEAESQFGAANGPLAAKRAAQRPKEISAAVSAVSRRATGQLEVTLENGQVWLQDQAVEYFPLKAGEKVQIKSAALGSFMLFAPSKRATRVTRIR